MFIADILERVNNNKSGIYERKPELVVVLPEKIALIIGDKKVHISEFIIAKIMGRIKNIIGHPEITDEIFRKIPENVISPDLILKDTRTDKKYLFIGLNPMHEIVVEVSREESGLTEINTIHKILSDELKRLGNKFPVVYSSGETPCPRMHASR